MAKAPKKTAKKTTRKPATKAQETSPRRDWPFFEPPAAARILVWGEVADEGPVYDYVVLENVLNECANVKDVLNGARDSLRPLGKVYILGSMLPGVRRKLSRSHLMRWFSWTGLVPRRLVEVGTTLYAVAQKPEEG